MPVAPEGLWAVTLEHLRDLLAELPAWQAWAGVGGANAVARAKARTHAVDLPPPEQGVDREYTPDELTLLRPFAVVDTMQGGLRLRKIAESQFTQGGSLVLCLEDNISDSDLADPAAAKIKFMNRVGAVIGDLLDYAGVDGRLNVTGVDLLTDVERSSLDEVPTHGERLFVYLKIDYGV